MSATKNVRLRVGILLCKNELPAMCAARDKSHTLRGSDLHVRHDNELVSHTDAIKGPHNLGNTSTVGKREDVHSPRPILTSGHRVPTRSTTSNGFPVDLDYLELMAAHRPPPFPHTIAMCESVSRVRGYASDNAVGSHGEVELELAALKPSTQGVIELCRARPTNRWSGITIRWGKKSYPPRLKGNSTHTVIARGG
jgi:hypothetical protein